MGIQLDAFAICKNEEEQIGYMLDCFAQVADMLGVLSIVDNNSSDSTLDIVYSYKDRIPMVVQEIRSTPHHGNLRNAALAKCRVGAWVFYLDSDETWTVNMRDWLLSPVVDTMTVWDFYKYSTIVDRNHYVEGGNGPSTRLFRNFPGTHFPQNIHTYPMSNQGERKSEANGPFLFDHTGCKPIEKLWEKGARYQWAAGTVGIGPLQEYVGRVDIALHNGSIREFDDKMKSIIFTGPGE